MYKISCDIKYSSIRAEKFNKQLAEKKTRSRITDLNRIYAYDGIRTYVYMYMNIHICICKIPWRT